jgi:hypothetical protein
MSTRAPKRSISQPCAGEKKVCSTMSKEKVNWMAVRPAPVVVWKGLRKSVQTYCGLEIAIMAIRPSPS